VARYLLIIENAGPNLSAYFPDVPGCVTTGGTVEEVRRNAHEALSLHLEDEPEAPRARTLREILDAGDVVEHESDVLAFVECRKSAGQGAPK
jgi:predicted RNase H-like HicB family nuclease